ncbi:MAG: hypothetical protein IJ313_11715 [Clostridia bacterium]|nr:hypothetical protein [Clostridia bacterium]
MTKYYKHVEGEYIAAIGTGPGGEEITREEYDQILSVICACPTAETGYMYKLRSDLTWELVQAPAASDPIISDSEALSIILGGETA